MVIYDIKKSQIPPYLLEGLEPSPKKQYLRFILDPHDSKSDLKNGNSY